MIAQVVTAFAAVVTVGAAYFSAKAALAAVTMARDAQRDTDLAARIRRLEELIELALKMPGEEGMAIRPSQSRFRAMTEGLNEMPSVLAYGRGDRTSEAQDAAIRELGEALTVARSSEVGRRSAR